MEVKGRPSPRRRSGGVKLEEVRAGGRRRGREQPRQSRVVPVLPDGAGAVSETGRYTGEIGFVTPLERMPALNPVDSGWFAVRTLPAPKGRGTSGGSVSPGSGGHGEGLRRSRGDAAG